MIASAPTTRSTVPKSTHWHPPRPVPTSSRRAYHIDQPDPLQLTHPRVYRDWIIPRLRESRCSYSFISPQSSTFPNPTRAARFAKPPPLQRNKKPGAAWQFPGDDLSTEPRQPPAVNAASPASSPRPYRPDCPKPRPRQHAVLPFFQPPSHHRPK